MPSESPFLNFKVECPICKTVNEYETVRVGAYVESGRDTDFCPVDIKWRFPRYQGYNPLLFFTATCSNCYYTREFTNKFKDWKNDTHFRTYRLKGIKDKHLEQLSMADSAVKRMGQRIDTARHPNESAILKMHLAIFDELLADRPSALDLGRFYLRAAWVYRHLNEGEEPSTLVLQGMMHEIDNKFSALAVTRETLNQDISNFRTTVESHFDSNQLSAEIKAQMLTFQERYHQAFDGLCARLNEFENDLSSMRTILNDYRTSLLGQEGSGAAFGSYPTFDTFMLELKATSDWIVTNEMEALEKAVTYYREAFANGRDISPGNQQIQASYLIAELSRRIGDFETARQYFASTIKAGQEFIYQNRNDQSRTVLARKIMELAIEQGRSNLAATKPA